MSTPMPVPPSGEVLSAELRDHDLTCRGTTGKSITCPCGLAHAFICDGCHQPVLMAVDPTDGGMCEHATVLLTLMGGPA